MDADERRANGSMSGWELEELPALRAAIAWRAGNAYANIPQPL